MRLGVSLLDFRLGVRMLARYPGLTLVGTLAMSAAIGLGAAYFEYVGDLLHPTLPLDEGDRVVAVQSWDAAASAPEFRSLHDFAAWRAGLRTVTDLGAFTTLRRNLAAGGGQAEPVEVAEISASAFRLARVPPQLGRPLAEADERPGAPPVVVIGHGVWKARFGGDPAVVGRTARLGEAEHTVVGVMPEGFAFPERHGLWVPLRADAAAYGPLQGPRVRVFGRLAPGATLEEARAELAAAGARAAADRPATHGRLRPRVVPYAESFFTPSMVWAIYGLNTLFVVLLLVACANVATLVYARTATREGEIAVRNALGAGRARIVAQLFVEALVLSSLAAAIGLAGADWGLRRGMELMWAAQGGAPPFWWNDRLAPGTVLYVAGLAVLAAVVAGVVPALKATDRRVQAGLQRLGAGGSSLRFGGTWTAVIVAQVALSVAFLPTAVSEGWSALRADAAGVGVRGGELLTVRLETDRQTRPGVRMETLEAEHDARAATVFAELERRLAAEPGVLGVTLADALPGMEHPRRRIEVEGAAEPADGGLRVRVASVAPDFFDVAGAPLVAGRAFRSGDAGSGHGVVIVNRAFARAHLGGGSPLGRRVRYAAASGGEPGPWLEVVGVAPDLAMSADPQSDAAGMYHPATPGLGGAARMAVRVRGRPEALAPRLRALAAATDPALRLYDLLPLDDVARMEQAGGRAFASLLALVAAIALLLSTVGLYALMSFTVAQRTREIGIRTALGADPRRIVAAIFSRALRQLGLGVAAGAAAAVLFGALGPGDQIAREGPWLLLAVSALMLLVGLASCVVPARRGLAIQPTEALKSAG